MGGCAALALAKNPSVNVAHEAGSLGPVGFGYPGPAPPPLNTAPGTPLNVSCSMTICCAFCIRLMLAKRVAVFCWHAALGQLTVPPPTIPLLPEAAPLPGTPLPAPLLPEPPTTLPLLPEPPTTVPLLPEPVSPDVEMPDPDGFVPVPPFPDPGLVLPVPGEAEPVVACDVPVPAPPPAGLSEHPERRRKPASPTCVVSLSLMILPYA